MKKLFKNLLVLPLFFFYLCSFSQNSEENIISSYENFGASTKEIVYVHLNKSVFIKNEMLGFSAYMLDKSKKTGFKLTHNLYCTISNEKNEVIKSKLVKVENGLANNIFKIDSLFTSGIYRFKAYTNWMLNFEERNFYEHPFQVIASEVENKTKKNIEETYNIQALPEGGHLVAGVKNTLGIIVKNKEGIGLENATGKIVNGDNSIVSDFTLNQFGIARAFFIPKLNEVYKIQINNNDKIISYQIENIQEHGIAFSIANLRGKVGVSFKTNPKTLKKIRNKKYLLTIHNGAELKLFSFSFNDKNEVSKIINISDLYSGINIFTVFDTEKNTPILERLFFNNSNINIAKTAILETKLESDSIAVQLKLNKAIDLSKVQNLSISVLPKKTKSYHFNSNILSQLYLEPYVRGCIQNADYYFNNTSAKTIYDLDNLLITQGWSSYNWENIFTKSSYKYKFEEGINLVANIKGKVKEGFLVYPLKNNKTQIFTTKKEEKAFVHTNLFPEENEEYRVSLLKKNSVTKKPDLELEFYPSKIPDLKIKSYKTKFQTSTVNNESYNFENINTKLNGVEELDEIVIEAKTKATKIEKIKNKTFGKVDFFTDNDTKGGQTLATYLNSRGWVASDFNGVLSIVNPNPNTPNNNVPLVILDDVQLGDFSFLANFQLNIVDYIETNKSGIGYGLRGGGGVIKIVTNPIKRMEQIRSKNDLASFKFPITFNAPKKYYTPVYNDYNSKFFKEYGTISWLPNLKANNEGVISFKILNTLTSAIVFQIQGLINDNIFISETKSIYPFDK